MLALETALRPPGSRLRIHHLRPRLLLRSHPLARGPIIPKPDSFAKSHSIGTSNFSIARPDMFWAQIATWLSWQRHRFAPNQPDVREPVRSCLRLRTAGTGTGIFPCPVRPEGPYPRTAHGPLGGRVETRPTRFAQSRHLSRLSGRCRNGAATARSHPVPATLRACHIGPGHLPFLPEDGTICHTTAQNLRPLSGGWGAGRRKALPASR